MTTSYSALGSASGHWGCQPLLPLTALATRTGSEKRVMAGSGAGWPDVPVARAARQNGRVMLGGCLRQAPGDPRVAGRPSTRRAEPIPSPPAGGLHPRAPVHALRLRELRGRAPA